MEAIIIKAARHGNYNGKTFNGHYLSHIPATIFCLLLERLQDSERVFVSNAELLNACYGDSRFNHFRKRSIDVLICSKVKPVAKDLGFKIGNDWGSGITIENTHRKFFLKPLD